MSNGAQQCCALDLPCCRPPMSQLDAVILTMAHGILGDTFAPKKLTIDNIKESDWYDIVRDGAKELLSQYGLVPKVVADAIKSGYAGFFQKQL